MKGRAVGESLRLVGEGRWSCIEAGIGSTSVHWTAGIRSTSVHWTGVGGLRASATRAGSTQHRYANGPKAQPRRRVVYQAA